jgi:hypothetical protein
MAFTISAYNDAVGYIRTPIMCGATLSLPNEQLFNIILQIVLPKTEQEWIQDFRKLVHFRKLPKNQHEYAPDPTRFTDWYQGTLEFIHEANEVAEFLAAVPEKNFTPGLKTFNQKPGLLQLFYDLIPQKLGKNINDMIHYEAIKQCNNLREYTKLFIVELNKLNDCTENSKLNRGRLNNNYAIATGDKEPPRFSSGKYLPNNNNFVNKHNNHNNSQIIPYKNPHEGRLNNLYNNKSCDVYYDQCDIDDCNTFRQNYYNNNDENDITNDTDFDNTCDTEDYYDIDETFGNRSNSIEGFNPGFNLTNNLSYVDRDSEAKPKQVCFDELYGKCSLGRECRFSHDFKDLQKEALRRQAALATCKYLPKVTNTPFAPPRTALTPTSILKRDTTLRAMGTVEEEFNSKVSNNNSNNTNTFLLNNNNRENNETRGGEQSSHGASLI